MNCFRLVEGSIDFPFTEEFKYDNPKPMRLQIDPGKEISANKKRGCPFQAASLIFTIQKILSFRFFFFAFFF